MEQEPLCTSSSSLGRGSGKRPRVRGDALPQRERRHRAKAWASASGVLSPPPNLLNWKLVAAIYDLLFSPQLTLSGK